MKRINYAITIGFCLLMLGVFIVMGTGWLKIVLYSIGFFLGGMVWSLDETLFPKLKETYHLDQPFTRTFLFVVLYVITAIFIATSSRAMMGFGFMTALGLLRTIPIMMLAFGKAQISNKHNENQQQLGRDQQGVQSSDMSDKTSEKTSDKTDDYMQTALYGGEKPFSSLELQIISIVLAVSILFLILSSLGTIRTLYGVASNHTSNFASISVNDSDNTLDSTVQNRVIADRSHIQLQIYDSTGTQKQAITAEAVTTPQSITQGLSGRSEIGSDGMLFIFSTPTQPSFWMVDMTFDLDMIWIADETVVGITADVPAPAPNTAPSALPLYPAPQMIDMVLEVPAGFSAENGISVGDQIVLT